MSIIHVTDSTRAGAFSDRTSFLGTKVPTEIRLMTKHLKYVDRPALKNLLQVVISSLEGKTIDYQQIKKLENDQLTEETLSYIYAGLRKLVQKAIRLPLTLKQENLEEDLRELKIKEEFIADIISTVLTAQQSSVGENIKSHAPSLPKIHTFRWRVDVSISTSVLNRALEPVVIMELVLDNGSVHNFEVPVSKFHELRYNTAFMLKEMENLEKRNILKVQD